MLSKLHSALLLALTFAAPMALPVSAQLGQSEWITPGGGGVGHMKFRRGKKKTFSMPTASIGQSDWISPSTDPSAMMPTQMIAPVQSAEEEQPVLSGGIVQNDSLSTPTPSSKNHYTKLEAGARAVNKPAKTMNGINNGMNSTYAMNCINNGVNSGINSIYATNCINGGMNNGMSAMNNGMNSGMNGGMNSGMNNGMNSAMNNNMNNNMSGMNNGMAQSTPFDGFGAAISAASALGLMGGGGGNPLSGLTGSGFTGHSPGMEGATYSGGLRGGGGRVYRSSVAGGLRGIAGTVTGAVNRNIDYAANRVTRQAVDSLFRRH